MTYDDEILAAACCLLVRGGMELERARRALKRRLGVDRTAIDRARRDNAVLQYPQLISDQALESVAHTLAEVVAEILAAERARHGP